MRTQGSHNASSRTAAESFVGLYYQALNGRRDLTNFYVSASNRLTNASLKPDISVNGNVCISLPELEALLEKQGQPVHYDVLSFDAQVLNPNFVIGAPESLEGTKGAKDGSKVMFSVQVSGTVKYGRGEGSEEKAFNEVFVLVPHWEASDRRAARNVRKFLVSSQNFRTL